MEDYIQDELGLEQSMWEEFSMHMDSSSLGEMQRIAAEARMVEDMEVVDEEISSENEVVIEEVNYANEVVIEEVNYANEVVIAAVRDVNEVVIDEVNDKNEEEASVCSEEIEPLVKMKHFLPCDKYFFVLDLVGAVKEKMRKQGEENFSKRFRYYDFKNISRLEKEFTSLIEKSTPDDYICVFETCKEQFIETYKPKQYTKTGFMNFCVAIAYLGIHCSTTGLDPSGESKATNYICSLMYEVLQRGTLDHSSWGRSYLEI